MSIDVVLALVSVAAFVVVTGAHDAANSIATSLYNRALTPRVAIGLTVFFKTLGAVLGLWVPLFGADALLRDLQPHQGAVMTGGAMVSAVVWQVVAWRRGWLTSGTHALLGGLAGAVLVTNVAINRYQWWLLVIVPLVAAPMVAFVVSWCARRILGAWLGGSVPSTTTGGSLAALSVTGAAVSLGHGLQMGQKMFAVVVMAAGAHVAAVSHARAWVLVMVGVCLGIGTLFAAKPVLRTLGDRLAGAAPLNSAIAQGIAAGFLYVGTVVLALPVSSTHTVVGAVVGAGAASRRREVRWAVALKTVGVWVFTVPVTMVMGAALTSIFMLI